MTSSGEVVFISLEALLRISLVKEGVLCVHSDSALWGVEMLRFSLIRPALPALFSPGLGSIEAS
jgi:hypothetical protein